MTQIYARGKLAFGFCDRCYQRYPLGDLTNQVVNTLPTGIKVCPQCNDVDQPQLQLGKYPINDPIALLQPRPDINPGSSLFGWAQVGNNATYASGLVGNAFSNVS